MQQENRKGKKARSLKWWGCRSCTLVLHNTTAPNMSRWREYITNTDCVTAWNIEGNHIYIYHIYSIWVYEISLKVSDHQYLCWLSSLSLSLSLPLSLSLSLSFSLSLSLTPSFSLSEQDHPKALSDTSLPTEMVDISLSLSLSPLLSPFLSLSLSLSLCPVCHKLHTLL